MTKEQILDEQIEALEKLLQLKSELLAAQERKIERLNQELAQEKQKTSPFPGWFTPQPYQPIYNPPVVGPGLIFDPGQITYGGVKITDGTSHITLNPDGTTSIGSATTGYVAPADSNVVSLAKK